MTRVSIKNTRSESLQQEARVTRNNLPFLFLALCSLFLVGAEERTRTSTKLPPQTPEACVSTNSTTPARQVGNLPGLTPIVNGRIKI